jgi:hypothetical protein
MSARLLWRFVFDAMLGLPLSRGLDEFDEFTDSESTDLIDWRAQLGLDAPDVQGFFRNPSTETRPLAGAWARASPGSPIWIHDHEFVVSVLRVRARALGSHHFNPILVLRVPDEERDSDEKFGTRRLAHRRTHPRAIRNPSSQFSVREPISSNGGTGARLVRQINWRQQVRDREPDFETRCARITTRCLVSGMIGVGRVSRRTSIYEAGPGGSRAGSGWSGTGRSRPPADQKLAACCRLACRMSSFSESSQRSFWDRIDDVISRRGARA